MAGDRTPLHPAIDRDLVEALVHDFYGRVRTDPEIGPVFEGIIADWTPHLETMVSFWCSVMRVSSGFQGQPMQKHLAIPGLGPRHFERWLVLFRASARDVTPPEVASIFIEMAERIARSLQLGLDFAHRQRETA
jgi:hemoglobin